MIEIKFKKSGCFEFASNTLGIRGAFDVDALLELLLTFVCKVE